MTEGLACCSNHKEQKVSQVLFALFTPLSSHSNTAFAASPQPHSVCDA